VRKFIYTIAALAIAFLTLTLARPALANQTPGWDMKVATVPGPSFETCANLKDWFVSNDENSADDPDGDRTPVPTVDGLQFSGNQLIHHDSEVLDTDNLKHGTFTANPAPDQNSFFSVEVANSDGSGYATLRWNVDTSKWEMTTGGQFYTDENPSKLVDLKGKSHHIVRFGVGYTANPKGTVTTVVSSVSFHGTKYDLTCQPPVVTTPPTTKATPTASHTVTAKPSTSSPSHPVGGAAAGGGSSGGALAITGPSGGVIAGVAGALVFFGALALWAVRKRKQTFVA
jgi:hypothetical protein